MNIDVLRIIASSDTNLFANCIKQYGLRVIGMKSWDPIERCVQYEDIASVASAITEDINDVGNIPEDVAAIKKLAESYGYIVEYDGGFERHFEAGQSALPGTLPAPTKPGTKPDRKREKEKRKKRSKPFLPPKPELEPEPKAKKSWT